MLEILTREGLKRVLQLDLKEKIKNGQKKMLKRYFLWKITLANKHTLMTVKIHF